MIKAIYNPFHKKELSYDSHIQIVGKYVKKEYLINEEHIKWINSVLSKYYDIGNGILPIAQHEYAALELLSLYDLSPRPIELGNNYIVMEKFGYSLSEYIIVDRAFFKRETYRILKEFTRIGFFHNDILSRNILFDGKGIRMIDFTLSEFNGIRFIDSIPRREWANIGDERMIDIFGGRSKGKGISRLL